MKKIIVIAVLFGASIANAGYFPPVGNELMPLASTECTLRFGKHGSAREACGKSVNLCQNWFGLTGQPYQDCQEGVLLLHGIRESDYPL